MGLFKKYAVMAMAAVLSVGGAIGVASVVANDNVATSRIDAADNLAFSIEFSKASSDGTTALDNTGLKNCISSGADNVSSFSSISRVYAGQYGVKLGSGSGTGSFVITLSDTTKVISKVGVKAAKYGSDTGIINIKIGSTGIGSVTPQGSGSVTEQSITSTVTAAASTITVSTTSKRAYVEALYFYVAGETPKVNSISLNPTSLSIQEGKTGSSKLSISGTSLTGSESATITYVPTTGTADDVTLDKTSAKNGESIVVTANKAGVSGTLKASYSGVNDATCAITTVENTEPTITISSTSGISLVVGEKTTSALSYTSKNLGGAEVSWELSDPSVASIDADGYVKALKAGSTTICATATVGGDKIESEKATITVGDTSLVLKKSGTAITSLALKYGGDPVVLTAEANFTGGTYTISGADESVCSVSRNNNEITITPASKDSASEEKTSCTLKVIYSVSGGPSASKELDISICYESETATYDFDELSDSSKHTPLTEAGLSAGETRIKANPLNNGNNTAQINKDGYLQQYSTISLIFSCTDGYYLESIEITYQSTTPVKADYSGITNATWAYSNYKLTLTVSDQQCKVTLPNTASGAMKIALININYIYSGVAPSADGFLEAVNALPQASEITTSNCNNYDSAVNAAYEKYDLLPDSLRTNTDVISAKAKLDSLKAAIETKKEEAVEEARIAELKRQAGEVDALIEALPDPSSISDYSHHSDIVSARAAYESLSDEAKTYVTKLEKLANCEESEKVYVPTVYFLNKSTLPGTIAYTDSKEQEISAFAGDAVSRKVKWKYTDIYRNNDDYVQINPTKTNLHIYNTVSLPGNASSVVLKTSSVLPSNAFTIKVLCSNSPITDISASGVTEVASFLTSSLTKSADNTFSISGTYGYVALYSPKADNGGALKLESISFNCEKNDEKIAKNFSDYYLHMNDYKEATNACAGADGYYAKAKAALATDLNENQLACFLADEAAVARMSAWAIANGEVFNAGDGSFTANNIAGLLKIGEDDATSCAIIAVIGFSVCLASFFFLRKKRA